jgi:ankyrin repeat protein
MLLKYGAYINQQDRLGYTALDIAYQKNNRAVIEELLRALNDEIDGNQHN